MSFMATYLVLFLHYAVAHAPEIIGVLMPFLVGYLNKDVPDEKARLLVTMLACFIAAVLLDWKQIAYGTPQGVFNATGVIFLESQAVYRLYFKNSLIAQKIKGTQ